MCSSPVYPWCAVCVRCQELEKHTHEMELQRVQAEKFEEDKKGLLLAIGENPQQTFSPCSSCHRCAPRQPLLRLRLERT